MCIFFFFCFLLWLLLFTKKCVWRKVGMMKGFTYKGRWCRKQYMVNDDVSVSMIWYDMIWDERKGFVPLGRAMNENHKGPISRHEIHKYVCFFLKTFWMEDKFWIFLFICVHKVLVVMINYTTPYGLTIISKPLNRHACPFDWRKLVGHGNLARSLACLIN